MGEKFDTISTMASGFIGSAISPLAVGPNSLITPTENVWFTLQSPTSLETFRGCTASFTNIGGPIILTLGNTWVTQTSGNTIIYINKSVWTIGTGPVKTTDPASPSSVITIATAQSILQIIILNGSVYAAAVQAGLSAPAPPTLSPSDSLGTDFTGLNSGTFASVITKFRSATGAESNPSDPSNVVSVTANSIAFTFPAVPIDGTDFWRVYVSPNGFGGSGPYLFLLDVAETDLTATGNGTVNIGVSTTTWTRTAGHTLTANDVGKQIVIVGAGVAGATLTTTVATVNVGAQSLTFATPASTSVVAAATTLNAFKNGIPRTIEVEWSDGQLILSTKPPLDHDPPPTGSFVFAIGNVMVVAGCYGGLGVACSVPGQPEAFNPDFVSFLPEPVVNVVGRPQDGFVFLICANSIHAAVYTGAVSGPPIMVRTLWDKVGCAGFGSAVVHGQVLYVFSGTNATKSNKLVRTDPSGQIDYQFSLRVDREIASWNPESVVLGYDDNRKVMAAFYNQESFPFHDALDIWSHLNLATVTGSGNPTGNIKGAYTQNGRLYLLSFESSQYNLYLFDEPGAGVPAWKWTPGWQNGLGAIDGLSRDRREHSLKTTKEYFLDYSATVTTAVTVDVLSDLNTNTPIGSFTASLASTQKMLRWIRDNRVAGRLFTNTWRGSGAGLQWYALQIIGTTSNIKN